MAPDQFPLAECLKHTLTRVMPCWTEVLVPAILGGKRLVIAAHGNSIPALVNQLDGIADAEIVGVDIPNGIPLVYALDAQFKPIRRQYLDEPEATARTAAAMASQGRG